MPRGIDPRDSAYLQGRLWTPAVLRPEAWFDGSDLSTISIATGVSEWRDKTGKGRTAAQTTTTWQPALVSNTPNGLSAISFDGSNDYMVTTSGSYAAVNFFIAATRCADTLSSTNDAYLACRSSLAFRGAASDISMIIAQNNTSGTNIGNSAANSTYAELNGTAVASLTNWNDFNTFSPFPVAVGEWLTIDHAISATSSGTKVFTIGADIVNPSLYGERAVQSVIGEILIFASELSLPQKRAMQGYLAWKWGFRLAADHPFANRPPLIGD